jgi:hypothetical protein
VVATLVGLGGEDFEDVGEGAAFGVGKGVAAAVKGDGSGKAEGSADALVGVG